MTQTKLRKRASRSGRCQSTTLKAELNRLTETEPWDRSGDSVGHEQDTEGTEEFSKAGTQSHQQRNRKTTRRLNSLGSSDDDLTVRTDTDDLTSEDGRESVLEVTVTVEGDRVSGYEPDVLAVGEDDRGSEVGRLEEGVEGVANGTEESTSTRLGLLERREVLSLGECLGDPVLLLDVGDERPDDGSEGEENGREERRVVVSEEADEGSRRERSSGSGDLVHHVDDGVHPSKLLDVSTNDVTGDNTTDLARRRSVPDLGWMKRIFDVQARPFRKRHH